MRNRQPPSDPHLLLLLLLCKAAEPAAATTFDVAVYGSSGAGAIAAVAARTGGPDSTTLLLSQTPHRQHAHRGLQHTDSNGLTVQGVAREFFVEQRTPGVDQRLVSARPQLPGGCSSRTSASVSSPRC